MKCVLNIAAGVGLVEGVSECTVESGEPGDPGISDPLIQPP